MRATKPYHASKGVPLRSVLACSQKDATVRTLLLPPMQPPQSNTAIDAGPGQAKGLRVDNLGPARFAVGHSDAIPSPPKAHPARQIGRPWTPKGLAHRAGCANEFLRRMIHAVPRGQRHREHKIIVIALAPWRIRPIRIIAR